MFRRLLLVAMLIPGLLGAAETASGADLFTEAEWQATARPSASAATVAPPALGPSIATLGVGVLAVAALALGLGWMAKRLGARRLVQGRGRHLEILEVVPLAYKRQMALVKIGDQVVLVGIGEHELAHLATLPAAAVLTATPTTAAPVPAASAFAQIMTRLGVRGQP